MVYIYIQQTSAGDTAVGFDILAHIIAACPDKLLGYDIEPLLPGQRHGQPCGAISLAGISVDAAYEDSLRSGGKTLL